MQWGGDAYEFCGDFTFIGICAVCHIYAGGSFWALLRGFIGGLLSVPVSLVKTLGNLLNQKTGTLVKKKQTLPNAALVTPILPLAVIALINFTVGLGNPAEGKVDPVAAAAAVSLYPIWAKK